MEEKYIVAIDLGSSKTAVGVANVEGGNIQIVYYREHRSDGVSKSAVTNEAREAKVLSEAIAEAGDAIGFKIDSVVASMPKYYIRQENRTAKMMMDPENDVTEDDITALVDMAQKETATEDDEDVYVAAPQSYSDGEEYGIREEDLIGKGCERLEGNYKIFIGKKAPSRRAGNALKRAGVRSTAAFSPLTTATAVLKDTEMENGVALVDLGAGATSVAIFKNGALRHYEAVPFGGRTITTDIAQECAISEKLAENIKKGYGVCLPDKLHNLSEKILQIRNEAGYADRQIEIKLLSSIITARMAEIINAVLYIIQSSGLADQLRCGIVLTGGGAEMTNCCQMFQEMSGINTRRGYPDNARRYCCTDGAYTLSATNCLGMILDAVEKGVFNRVTEQEVPEPEVTVQETAVAETAPEGADTPVKKTGTEETETFVPRQPEPKKPKKSFGAKIISTIFDSMDSEESEEEKARREEERREKDRRRKEEAERRKKEKEEKERLAREKAELKEKTPGMFEGIVGKLFDEEA